MRGLTGHQAAEIAAGLTIAAIAGAGYLAVPQMVSGWAFVIPGTTDGPMTPAFFPQIALATTATFALLVAVSAPMRHDPLPLLEMTWRRWGRLAALLAISLAYLGALHLVGFIAASTALMLALALIVGFPLRLPMLATAFLLPPVVSTIFWYGLRVQLPTARILELIASR